MHTLSQLHSGELAGIQRLSLSEELTTFPMAILSLADSLEVLDLSNNQLSHLPNELTQLHKLKILFLADNPFEVLPEILGQCLNLEMIGFKSNNIHHVPENSLPPKLRWLILTNNRLTTLPDSLGERPYLQKLALAGNSLTELPNTLSQSKNLELIRISANQLTEFPAQILHLPKLAWIAFSGNPFSEDNSRVNTVPEIPSSSFTLKKILGRGASGIISMASWNTPQPSLPKDIAVKVFKGEITSDGYPRDELQSCLKAGHHPNLIQPLAQVNEDNYLALIMDLIPPSYHNLGLPPSLSSCTRDTFPKGFTLSISDIDKIVLQMQSVFEHLHKNKVCHGDLYAHNTLLDEKANIIFGDFGAASMYHMLTKEQQEHIQAIEKRALCYFVDDLLNICREEDRLNERYYALKGEFLLKA